MNAPADPTPPRSAPLNAAPTAEIGARATHTRLGFRRPRLRTVLILVNLVVLGLPVAGIQLMRLYESALVRQTESTLIAQAAFIAAFYRTIVTEEAPDQWRLDSRAAEQQPETVDGVWRPRPPLLDLATSPRLPPFPDGAATAEANPLAQAVGKRLQPVLRDAQLTTLAGIRVVDPWGVIVASTGDDVGSSVPPGTELDEALRGSYSSVLRLREDTLDETSPLDSISRTSDIRVFVAAPITIDDRLVGGVLLSRTPSNIVQALYNKRGLLLQALAGLLALVILMSVITSRLVALPITRLAKGATEVAAGRADRLEVQRSPRTFEMAQLQNSVAAMAQTLEQRAQSLQEFSRHVSHEFKTPITGIQGAVEVLQDHGDEMSSEQYQRFLHNISADADRLRNLTTRLLDLTRADIASANAQPTELVELLQNIEHKYRAQAAEVLLINPGTAIEITTNPSLIEAVLDTLIENALQQQANQVRITLRSLKDWVYVEVSDNGAGISDVNREKIFEPFFTNRRESGGTGLGLTIAAKLAANLNGELVLLPLESGGSSATTFRLSLPR